MCTKINFSILKNNQVLACRSGMHSYILKNNMCTFSLKKSTDPAELFPGGKGDTSAQVTSPAR